MLIPLESKYIRDPITLGGKIKNRRLALNLRQSEIAEIIQVSVDSITNWENNLSEPQIHFYPKIFSFLGCYPFTENCVLPYQIKKCRYIHGLTQNQFGKKIGVDGSTICSWETGETKPRNQYLNRLQKYLVKISD